MVGERSGPLAGTFRRPWVGATDSKATMDLSKAGRGGVAGVLSAMDGAKQGTHGRSFCRPPPSHPAPPTSSPAAFDVAVAVASAGAGRSPANSPPTTKVGAFAPRLAHYARSHDFVWEGCVMDYE